MDDSTLSLKRSMNGEIIACSPEAVSLRESAVEEAKGRDDVDWVGVVLGESENNFGHRLFEEYLWLCSEGASEMGRLEMLNPLKDLDCLERCELSFAMSMRTRDNKR